MRAMSVSRLPSAKDCAADKEACEHAKCVDRECFPGKVIGIFDCNL